jgi:hypothetical protein
MPDISVVRTKAPMRLNLGLPSPSDNLYTMRHAYDAGDHGCGNFLRRRLSPAGVFGAWDIRSISFPALCRLQPDTPADRKKILHTKKSPLERLVTLSLFRSSMTQLRSAMRDYWKCFGTTLRCRVSISQCNLLPR